MLISIFYSFIDGLIALYFLRTILPSKSVNLKLSNILLFLSIFISSLPYNTGWAYNTPYLRYLLDICVFIYPFLFLVYSKVGRISEKYFWTIIYVSIMYTTFLIKYSICYGLINFYQIYADSSSIYFLSSLADAFIRIIRLSLFILIPRLSIYIKFVSSNILYTIGILLFGAGLVIHRILLVAYKITITYSLMDYRVFSYFTSFTFILLISQVIFLYLLFLFSKELSTNIDLKMKVINEDTKKKYYENLMIIQSDLKSLKHDFKNHLSVMISLLNSDNKDGLCEYIKEIDIMLDNTNKLIYTECIVLNSIISSKKMICDEKNINTNISVTVPKDIKIPDIDICILLGNLLDNAIESCEKCNFETFIDINIFYRNNFIIFIIKNSSNGKFIIKNNKYLTSKKADFHGIGLYQINKIVNKYNGYYSTRYDKHIFTTEISLKNIIS